MKLLRLCLLLSLALFGIAVSAEPPGDDHWLEHMKSKLNLSEQQVGEVKKIHEELKPERDALREQHKALHAKMVEKLKSVLTPEQQKQLESMHEKHEHAMHGEGKGKGAMENCPMHCQGKNMEECAKHCADANMKECPAHGPGAASCAEHCGADMKHCPSHAAAAGERKRGKAAKQPKAAEEKP